MPSSTISLKATGLQTSPNPLELQPGALIEASNVIIKRNDVIESRRGFALYGESFGSQSDRAKQLMEYQKRIIRHFSNILQYDTGLVDDNGVEVFAQFAGTYLEPQTGIRIKSVNANNNLYFTTSQGIQKISSTSASGFTPNAGFITPAGGIKAIDLSAELVVFPGEQNGFLQQDSSVSYRAVWGTNDANGNLVLGTPSQSVTISNPLISLLLLDFNRVLAALDNISFAGGSLINFGNYVSTFGLPASASPAALYTNLVSLAATLDNNILIAAPSGAPLTVVSAQINSTTGVTVVLSGSAATYISDGDNIALTGFTNSSLLQLNGQNFTVNSVAGSTLTLTINPINGVTAPLAPLPTNTLIAAPASAPVQVVSAQVTGSTDVTVVFSASVAGLLSPGDTVNLSGFTAPALTQLNGLSYTVDTVVTSTITLTVIGTSGLTVVSSTNDGNGQVVKHTSSTVINDGNGEVNSFNYEIIAPPAAPAAIATDQDLVNLQNYLRSILLRLQVELSGVITPTSKNNFILPIVLTTTANVQLTVDIPAAVTSSYFLQIYRSNQATATGTTALQNITPNDELQLVYEAFPTAAQLAAHQVVVVDITPDEFKGANLYTNAISGEGILQANDVPPLSLDINLFKGYTFYANTQTKQLVNNNLLGVQTLKAGNITNISVANPTVITTDAPHLLSTGDIVWIDNTDSTPAVTGLFAVTVLSPTTFSVPVNVTVAGDSGYWTNSLISISNGITNTLYKLIKGTFEQTTFTVRAANDAVYNPGTLGGKYFTINSANDDHLYYVWYQTGSDTDPAVVGRTGIVVFIGATDTAPTVASKTASAISTQGLLDFVATASTNTVTITNNVVGYTSDATVGTSLFNTPGPVIIKGIGENASKQEVLLSTLLSPAEAVDQTARSLIHVINQNPSESVYGFYLSGPTQVPGQMSFEARSIGTPTFYIVGNNNVIGTSFSPNISPFPNETITNTVANPTVVHAVGHGLVSGDQVLIEFSNSTPSIDGIWTVTVLTADTFSIPANVTVAGTTGVMINVNQAQASTNQAKPNRIYYSKFQQPEAVPQVNFLDVGAENHPILRIFPLRDSLFVFKEDGLFRISGEVAPFNIALFDGSCILIAADSLDITNNLIFGWTTQGVQIVSEAGANLISRPIDVDILPLASANFPNFPTATWGIGYKSDNAYLVFTVQEPTDTEATICYRYSNLTSTWTTFDITDTCGLVLSADDKLYLGAGDINFLEQERKTFSRLDYADRDFTDNLDLGNYLNGGLTFQFQNATNYATGDVIVQTQTISNYNFDSLLAKLDADPGVWNVGISAISTGSTFTTITTSTAHGLNTGDFALISSTDSAPAIDGLFQITFVDNFNFTIPIPFPIVIAGTTGFVKFSYLNNFRSIPGNSMRTNLTTLASKLDIDPGITFSGFSALIGDIGPITITSNSATNPTVVTAPSHGLANGRVIQIGGSNSVPPIDGKFQITFINSNEFSIPVSVMVAGTAGTFTTDVTDFDDIRACYNAIIDQLNLDPTVNFHNYQEVSDDTIQEVIINSVNYVLNKINVNQPLAFIVGPVIIYKAINATFTYAPLTFGDTLGLKHVREATIMFENKAFTTAMAAFSTDLLPQFIQVPIPGDGNGLFGFQPFGAGFFGGASNSAPFRTYIPQEKQRCRYIVLKFTHDIAREIFSVFGATLTGEVQQSSRAYR